MFYMTPPDKYIAVVKNFVTESVTGLVEGCSCYIIIGDSGELFLDCSVNTIRIDFLYTILILFMIKLIPDYYIQFL